MRKKYEVFDKGKQITHYQSGSMTPKKKKISKMAHTLSNLIQKGQFKILFVSNLKSVKKNQFKLWRFFF